MVNQTTIPGNVQGNKSRKRGQFLVIAVFVGLVLIPIILYGARSEMARWKAARAELLLRDGMLDESLALMQSAVEQAPHNQNLKLDFAKTLMSNGQADRALELIDSVIEYSANPRPAIEAKAKCLMYLGKAQEALVYYKSAGDYLDPQEYQQPNRLNEMAYFRALAKLELPSAREDIAEANLKIEQYYWWLDELPAMRLADQTLLATALIATKIGCPERVLDKLTQRVSEMRTDVQRKQERLSRNIYSLIHEQDLESVSENEGKIHTQQVEVRGYERWLAVLLVARAHVYQELGVQPDSDLDRIEVQQMDFDPDELLSRIHDDWNLMEVMSSGAQFLDTDSVVKIANGEKLLIAAEQLDCSVLALEVLSLTSDNPVRNTMRDERGDRYERIDLMHVEAVIRLHRAQLRERLGETDKAKVDYQRIRELGFDPDDNLF